MICKSCHRSMKKGKSNVHPKRCHPTSSDLTRGMTSKGGRQDEKGK
jgi:hypothetical protein